MLERGALVSPILELGHRSDITLDIAARVRAEQEDETVGVLEGEASDQQAVHHAERRRVGSNAERQGRNGNGGKAGTASQRPQGESYVGQ